MKELEREEEGFSAEVEKKIVFEERPENRIHVDYSLDNPHTLVRHTRSQLRRRKPDKYGRLQSYEPGCLDINVGPDSADRALCIVNALILAIEARGGRVFVSKPERYSRPETFIEILGEKVAVSLEEPSKQTKHVLTAKELRDKERYPSLNFAPKYDHVPSGQLVLKIKGWGRGIRQHMRDGIHKRIDSALNRFMIALYRCAEHDRKDRLERERAREEHEEQRRRHWEMRRKEEKEAKELAGMLGEADNWRKAQLLRRYRHAATEAYLHAFGAIPAGSDFFRWSARVAELADKLDPSRAFQKQET